MKNEKLNTNVRKCSSHLIQPGKIVRLLKIKTAVWAACVHVTVWLETRKLAIPIGNRCSHAVTRIIVIVIQ